MRSGSLLWKEFRWIESETLTLHKSRFKGYCVPLDDQADVADAIRDLYKLHSKLGKATHPAMYAWKTADHAKDNAVILRQLTGLNQGWDDCHEGGSGQRLMGLLDRMKLVNVLVAVTRWYGGTQLGPARFRCISDVALEALKKADYGKSDGKGWVDVAAAATTTTTTTTKTTGRSNRK